MTRARTKLIIGGATLLIAVVLLGMAGMREGWVYYLSVDQFLTSQDHNDRRVRLQGQVGDENFEQNAAMLDASFDLMGETRHIRVNYQGVIPDLFEPGREVVVEGHLGSDGVFEADTLMTKCASKYETRDGQSVQTDPLAPEAVP
jgi:cytochrome c-type biogenesis protein CcmE